MRTKGTYDERNEDLSLWGDDPYIDLAEGERRKKEGMEFAASNRRLALEAAKELAITLARVNGTVTADDVYRGLLRWERQSLGNAAGSIFRGKEWEWTGRFVKSKRVSNHARVIREWRLK